MGELVSIDHQYSKQPFYSIDVSSDVLTDIYDKDINIAIYQRSVSDNISSYANEVAKLGDSFGIIEIVELEQLQQLLNRKLPDSAYRDEFIDDLCMVCDMYAVLFDLDRIGFRLTVLEHAMCPRFHVDNIPCRLLTTYGDTGTEWLSEDNVDRNKLGRGNQGLPDDKSGIYFKKEHINRIDPFNIALLKGEAWPENVGRGLVHRSPAVPESGRLLLSLDFA